MARLAGDWFSLSLLTALFWGIAVFCEKRGTSGIPPTEAVFVRCFAAAFGMIVAWALNPSMISTLKQMRVNSILWLMAGGFIGSVLGQFANLAALRAGEVSRVSVITGCWPILTFALGTLLLGESFSWTKMGGLALIVSGIMLMKL